MIFRIAFLDHFWQVSLCTYWTFPWDTWTETVELKQSVGDEYTVADLHLWQQRTSSSCWTRSARNWGRHRGSRVLESSSGRQDWRSSLWCLTHARTASNTYTKQAQSWWEMCTCSSSCANYNFNILKMWNFLLNFFSHMGKSTSRARTIKKKKKQRHCSSELFIPRHYRTLNSDWSGDRSKLLEWFNSPCSF